MNIEKSNLELGVHHFQGALEDALLVELNVYNHAFLELTNSLARTSSTVDKSEYEIPALFEIKGEVNGHILCLLDTFHKEINDKKAFHSLYSESMNILLGKISSKLENVHHIHNMITAPLVFNHEVLREIEANQYKNINLHALYTFIHNRQEFNCRILFNFTRKFYTKV